jgi:hypothetical protein
MGYSQEILRAFSLYHWLVLTFIRWPEHTYVLKGIVSRDFVVCFWCHSIDLTFLHIRSGFFAFKSSFSYRIFQFSYQAVVSLLCEWSLAIRISAATVIAHGFRIL